MSDEFIEEEGAETPEKPDEEAVPETEFTEESEESEEVAEEEIVEEDATEEVSEEEAEESDEAPSEAPEAEAEEETEAYSEEETEDAEAVFEDEIVDESEEEAFEEEVSEERYAEEGDSYVEESEESWFDRLGDAVKGVIIGGVIFLIGFPVLFLNEGRAVRQYKNLKEGAGSVISVPADKADPANNGKLVHVTGLATTDEVLSDGGSSGSLSSETISPDRIDPANNGKLVRVTGLATTDSVIPDKDFGVSATAIKLQRKVFVYQWKEASEIVTKPDGKKVRRISYKKVWSDKFINSDGFKKKEGHVNPKSAAYKSKTLSIKKVRLGAFDLPVSLIRQMNNFETLPLDTAMLAKLPQPLQGKVSIDRNTYFMGSNPKAPQIGDLRVMFKVVRPQMVTVMARQEGKTLAPYASGSGEMIAQLSMGSKAPESQTVSAVSAKALKLRRSVQMYQWQENVKTETEKKVGGGKKTRKTYSYSKVWSGSLINSDGFKKPGHHNPKVMPLSGKELVAQQVKLGDFDLPSRLLSRLSQYEPLTVNTLSPAIPPELRGKTKMSQGGYYIGKNPQNPAIGDMKVSYSVVRPLEVTIVAQQSGNSFAPYATEHGTIEEFVTGSRTADSLFKSAQKQNTLITWLLRAGGFLLMFIGLSMVFRPISVVFDVLPFLGNIAEIGTGIVAGLIAAGFSLITISVAWFFYRPLLAILLVVAGVGLVFGVRMLRGRKGTPPAPRKSVPPPQPPPPPPGA